MKKIKMMLYTVIAIYFIFVTNLEAQINTPEPTPTDTSVINPMPNTLAPTPYILEYEQALNTYTQFSTEVVRSAGDTIEMARWIFAALTALAAIGTATITYIARQAHLAAASAKIAEEKAKESSADTKKARAMVSRNLKKLEATKREIERLERELKYIEPVNIQQVETIALVKIYGVQLFNSEQHSIAATTLIEYSLDDDAVIRLEVLQILGRYISVIDKGNLNKEVVGRVREIASSDSERALQLEAQRILSFMERKLEV